MCRRIENNLLHNIAFSFFRRQEINFNMWKKEQIRIAKKISNLRAKHTRQEILKINSINYNISRKVESEVDVVASVPPSKFNIVLTKVTNLNKIYSGYNINITPDIFNESFDIRNINEHWLINLSNINISDKAIMVLQLGQQFNLPNNLVNKEVITCKFIKHVEGNLFKADDDTSKNIRNETVQILKSINKCNIKSFENTVLSEGVAEVKRLISDNTDILITRADKGNTTVVLSRDSYKEKNV